MEYLNYMKESRKRVEKLILVFDTLFTIGIVFVIMREKWAGYLSVLALLGLAACWWMSFKEYRSYRFRGVMTSLILYFVVMLLGVYSDSLLVMLTYFIAVIIMLALYGIPEVIKLSGFVIAFLGIFHVFVSKTADVSTPQAAFKLSMQIFMAYFVVYIVYTLIKKQVEGNENLLKAIQGLKLAEQGRDDFMANVSHEIRTPLNTICGMSEMALREEISGKAREDLLDIQAAGRSLMTVVSDILDFSELQSGSMEMIEDSYNITSTINDVISMTLTGIHEKKIEMTIDCEAGIPSGLIGDEQKIRRVMLNIVNNAVKFTSEGCVSLHIGCRRESYGVNLVISVKDTGIGMSEESLEELFTDFHQLDAGSSRREEGIGLGLAISQMIVNKMGGFITVESAPGRGSQIQFVIPQKVQDETPIIVLKNPEAVHIIAYFNLEKFDIMPVRDEYMNMMHSMGRELKVDYVLCRNLAEMKRRMKREKYTHLFITPTEYYEDTAYFDGLSRQISTVVIGERRQVGRIENPYIRHIFKPFYILPVAMILNGEDVMPGMEEGNSYEGSFVAPQAHVLVVDDNRMNLRVIEGLLKPYQIKVTVADSGRQALEKIESMDYDFVFMDHMMPEMDGIETMHRIRRKVGSYYQRVPIIALTANAIAGAREMFLAEGFQDFVSKPVELSILERVLRNFIPDHKLVKIADPVPADEAVLPAAGEETEKELSLGDIDVEQGIAFCGGGLEDYIDVVRIYYASGLDSREEIKKAYEEKDWNRYAVFVHALKSTSMGIGAGKLSEMAKALEEAAKNSEESYIFEHHAQTMEEYARILGLIKENKRIVPETAPETEKETGEETAALTADLWKEKLDELEEALNTFESEGVEQVLSDLKNYTYEGQRVTEILEDIRTQAEQFDFLSALDSLAELKEKLR